jgi:hypothetical protein
MSKSSAAYLLFITLSLVSCGGSNGGGSKLPNVEKLRGFSTVEIGDAVRYQSDCYAEKYEDTTIFQKATFEFKMTSADEADYKMTTLAFTDSTCTIPVVLNNIEGSGTLSNSNRLFEVYVDQLLMTPLMTEVADAYNDMELCGFNDWQNNASQDITSCLEGNLTGNFYINTNASETAVTLYLCESGAPLTKDCGKINFTKF